jgi:hypothetical protein
VSKPTWWNAAGCSATSIFLRRGEADADSSLLDLASVILRVGRQSKRGGSVLCCYMLLLSLLVTVAIGCRERGGSRELHESNLRLVVVLHSQYLAAHGGEAPRDADDFRESTRARTGRLMRRLCMNRAERAARAM